MVPSKRDELEQQIARIIRNPRVYLSGATDDGVSLVQLLESLTAIPAWSWLSRDTVVQHIERSEPLSLVGSHVRLVSQERARAQPNVEPSPLTAPHVYLADPDDRSDGYLNGAVIENYPSSLWLEQLSTRRESSAVGGSWVHLAIDAALCVSWALSGNLETAAVAILPESALKGPVFRHPDSPGALLASQVDVHVLRPVPASVLQEHVGAAREHVWTMETLYLDEPDAQSLAAKKLFKTVGQRQAEVKLVPHLSDSDPRVRVNVLNALGVPAYTVGFVPGAPLPPRDRRLEPVALEPETVASMIDLAERESDQDVLEAIVCTLSMQPFGGSLRPLAAQARNTLTALVPRLQSEQGARDARRVIRELRRITERN